MSEVSRYPGAIQLPEQDSQLVSKRPSHWHFANFSACWLPRARLHMSHSTAVDRASDGCSLIQHLRHF
jgi:hypothetical protein